jgi:predicted nucleic acid-binding protein
MVERRAMTVDAAAFLDTNVLLYAMDPRNAAKQALAAGLVERLGSEGRAMVSTQVLIELFNNLHRKLGQSRERAAVLCYSLTDWTVVASDLPLVMKAMARSAQNQLSIWDSMIVEAALAGGAQVLYSEDLQAGQRFGALQVINPFAVGPT